MIVTVTLNAALDVSYEADGLSWQSTRDVARVRHRAGGRGVAVARVLHTSAMRCWRRDWPAARLVS